MADWDPVQAVKQQYPNMGMSDSQILQNLQDPGKFRAAFPQYTVSDDDIRTNMGKFAMTHPEYSALPNVQPPTVNMQKSNVGIATGSEAESPMNPMQPGEQWAIQNPGPALGAAGIGAAGAAIAGAPTAVNAAAAAATPAVVAAGNWAEANPRLARLLFEGAKATGYGAAMYKGLKKATK